jgi:hypothetical protein
MIRVSNPARAHLLSSASRCAIAATMPRIFDVARDLEQIFYTGKPHNGL